MSQDDSLPWATGRREGDTARPGKEFIAVILEDGCERGIREIVDVRTTYEGAASDGAVALRNHQRGAHGDLRLEVLVRDAGPWRLPSTEERS